MPGVPPFAVSGGSTVSYFPPDLRSLRYECAIFIFFRYWDLPRVLSNKSFTKLFTRRDILDPLPSSLLHVRNGK